MKKSRFTDSQIMAILKQWFQAGIPIARLSSSNVSTASIYQWRAKSPSPYGLFARHVLIKSTPKETRGRQLQA